MPQPVTLKKLKRNGLWRPTRSSRTDFKKRCPFHHRGLECKSRMSRDTWSNRQAWSWSTKWSMERQTGLCEENALVVAITLFQQHKRWLYTWTSPDGQHQNQSDYILCSQRWRCSIQSAKTRPGLNYSSDHELLIAKFRLKLKKIGKTNMPFKYDLNQIPYDYTAEVMNRFKGLDLIQCLKNYTWRFVTLDRRQWSRPSPRKRNAKRQKVV